ncbi:MAG: hypothetical protein JNL40_01230 [Cyclobacteriaceae bacterium]|nr:hypothetical protein [Cyclobacteriaceae bacterium]
MQYYLSKDALQTLLSRADISRLDKLLLILFFDNEVPKTLSRIKELGSSNGLRECIKWNISDILSKSQGKATSIKSEWSLTAPGRSYLVTQKLITERKTQLHKDVADLRSHLTAISNPQTKSFLEEAISCLEADLNRAAVVYSWIGAVAVLYDEVVNKHLTTFNAEAVRRDSKWKNAKTTDDLSRMKEQEFLNILESISLVGKNVKLELQQCLQLRNACGHPNTLKIGERKVAAHIEVLILNLFTKF